MSDPSVTVTLEDFVAESRARHERSHAQEVEQIRQVWEIVEALQAAGFPIEHKRYDADGFTMRVSVDDLQRINKTIGGLKHDYNDVVYEGGKPCYDKVEVNLRARKCRSAQFTYIRPLPAIERSPKKCRIETVSRVETSTRLVCDRA